MNNKFRRIVVILALAAGAVIMLFVGGNALARGSNPFGWANMMGGNSNNQSAATWIGNRMGFTGTMINGAGIMGSDAMQQMMDGTGMLSNGDNMMNGGMMGFGSTSLLGTKPLSVDQVTSAVNSYLTKLGNKDLTLAEVMIFDNNAYAIIIEKSTGAGALELLVNPATQAVYPEPGPNMMWNTKYSPMRNMMGGSTVEATTAMPVSAADALKTAQAYLDENLPGAKTAEDAEAFYGYFTMDILRDGKVVGMLSVNGYTSAVFLHTWHGNFIEMSKSGR